LIAQLLLTAVQMVTQTKKAFSVVASLVRIHFISILNAFEMLRSTRREYGNKSLEPPGLAQQLKLALL